MGHQITKSAIAGVNMDIIKTIMESCDRIVQRYEKNENNNLVAIGVTTGIAAIVMACVATHKSEKIINDTKTAVIDIQNNEEIPEEEKPKAIVKTVGVSALKVAGWYTAVGTLQFTSFKAYGKTIDNLQNENMILTSIATSALSTLANYRRAWQEKVGKEAEEEVYYDAEKKTITVVENGKTKKKKAHVMGGRPANKNILLFAPWTSPLYVDEEECCCPGMNRDRIRGAIRTASMMLQYSYNPFVSNNNIAYLLQIKESSDWYTEGFIRGDNIQYNIREVYAIWEGKYIPVYYIELNSMPMLEERLKEVMPEAPDYTKDLDIVQ